MPGQLHVCTSGRSIPWKSVTYFHFSDVNIDPWSVRMRFGYPVYKVHEIDMKENQLPSTNCPLTSPWLSRNDAAENRVRVSIICSIYLPL